MRIKILNGCTEDSINVELIKIEERGNEVVEVKFFPQTANHYKTYCSIVYKREK